MQILSATDAVSPAIARTKLVLFTPFRIGRTWKLCATAYVSTLGLLFFPFPLIYLFFVPTMVRMHLSKGLITGAILGIVAVTALCLWLFHLCSRLQFAFFDIVLNRGEFVAPAWRKYGPQSRKWTAAKVLFGTAVTLALAAPVVAYARHFISIMDSIKPGQPPPPEFISAMLAGYGLVFLGFGSLFILSALFADFITPSLALENTTLGEAFQRMLGLVRREPGQLTAYFFIKLGMAIGGYMAGAIVLEIVLLIVVLILAIIGGIIGFLLHLAGVPTTILTALAVVVGFIFYFVLISYATALAVGPLVAFLQAYTLFFLGGRYPLLGALLESSTPLAAAPPGYMYAAAPMYAPPAAPSPEPASPAPLPDDADPTPE